MWDIDLVKYVKTLKIPYFRGIFMRDTLPVRGPNKNECAILNLDTSRNQGTHWVAYIKRNNSVNYFDSFGSLKPPLEFIRYMGAGVNIMYNNDCYQDYNQINCGHLCLEFLYKNT